MISKELDKNPYDTVTMALSDCNSLQLLRKTSSRYPLSGSSKYTITDDFELLQKGSKKSDKEESVKREKQPHYINKQKVRQRLTTHLHCQRGYKQLYMLTISFPPMVKDDIAYKLLNLLFTKARQQSLLKSYLWVAERQQNNTIHYHCCVTHYVNIQAINRLMVDNLKSYIRKGLINWSQSEAEKYNGCDLAKDRNSKKVTNYADYRNRKILSHYITKYVTKNTEGFEHLAWHNSRDFSAIFIKQRIMLEQLKKVQGSVADSLTAPFFNEWVITHFWKCKPPDWTTNVLKSINDSILEMLGYYSFKNGMAESWNFRKVSKAQVN